MVEPQPAYSLARLTTVRTGGAAEFFAAATTPEELLELLRWAQERALDVHAVGSGSNLLVADDGVRGLVVKLEGELARIERDGDTLVCGGGARLPAIAAAAARLGLGGIEFAVNIPGTVGGAVRMNANAYDGVLADVLEWVEIATHAGLARRAPEELGFAYRSSSLGGGEIVVRARFVLTPAPSEDVRAVLAQMRERRHAAQPKGIRTFGSTFKNPPGGRTAGELLAEAGVGDLRVGGARFSRKHANFVENAGGASTADILALLDAGRRRVSERFGIELEPEVQLLGDAAFPWQ
ncbi:MAG TPA: UDP-N-acetylmuramate dehydrogenase [Solirubrobacteraceae bacterium]|nr:UDP-N-acetylmuramate dehydrogenase [Solirubrobacteraceae bacterium]